MNQKKRIINLALVSFAILCFQILYYQLTVAMLQSFAQHIPGLSNDCYLMVHHSFQFLMLFVPTILLHFCMHIDFGYHIKEWKKGLKWFFAGVAIELLICLLSALTFGFSGITFQADSFLFQLFFSGLGEEICYRTLPLVILPYVWGEELVVGIGSRCRIDIAVIISALFFSIGHISFQFGKSGISYSTTQLITAFLIGIVLGMIYKRTNSVWACMASHGIYNVFAIML